MKIVLKAEDLQAFYVLQIAGRKKVIHAVNGVNLEIRENAVYGIAGESGCGKTTLLRVLFAKVDPPLHVVKGVIYYRENDSLFNVLELDPEQIRKLRWTYISYIPQGSMSVFNPVKKMKSTFLDFLQSHVQSRMRKELLALAEEYLRKLGLSPQLLNAYPHQLSGGMRQRVSIALATLLKPRVILADEPTTALDVVAQRAVLQLLREIQKEFQNTIVLVTHDMGIHANIATDMVIMYAGKIVEEASTEEIFVSPLHPYTRYLINSLPRIGDKRVRESAPGNPPSLVSPPPGCAFHPRCPHALEICSKEEPRLVEVSAEHKVACWLYGGTDHGTFA